MPGARLTSRRRSRPRPRRGRPSSSPAERTSWTRRRSPSARSSAAMRATSGYGIERIEAALPRIAEVPQGRARPWEPASTRRTGSRRRSSRTSSRDPTCRSPRPSTISRPSRTATGSSRRPERCAPSPCPSPKINNDLRWMGSGPNTGLGEIHIPDLRARILDHARQGQPRSARSRAHGVRSKIIGQRRRQSPGPARQGAFELNVAIPAHGHAHCWSRPACSRTRAHAR